MENAKGVCSPGTKEEGTTKEDHEKELETEQATLYRAMVARLNYLAADRSDLSFSVKELARTRANPPEGVGTSSKEWGDIWWSSPEQLYITNGRKCWTN